MTTSAPQQGPRRRLSLTVMCSLVGVALGGSLTVISLRPPQKDVPASNASAPDAIRTLYPRRPMDMSGYSVLTPTIVPWGPKASFQEVRAAWDRLGYRNIEVLDRRLEGAQGFGESEISNRMTKAVCFAFEGKAEEAYQVLTELRRRVEARPELARGWLSCIMYFQGVAALRRGENENCIMCRGESSCILPISAAAVHKNPAGSRLAIQHFCEYLEEFPGDLEVQWLLNLAHMTLGEHPHGVDPKNLLPLDHFQQTEVDIGRFRDVGHLVGVNRFNQAGGALMDDFDNDGLLDLAVPSFDAAQVIGIYRNKGDGTFEESAKEAGIDDQFGGLTLAQTDFNNDGLLDIYIPRGAWLPVPIRPTLLRNEGQFQFTDVTEEAGLLDPLNSNAALWADYDNDGWLDLFVCCERPPHRLYHNRGNGTFEEVAFKAGVADVTQTMGKGCTWIDYDNDDYPDLFINYLNGMGQLFHNERNGTFINVTGEQGIDGPRGGFSCWAWDYDNDGWLDIFATCYERTLAEVVKGVLGKPHNSQSNRLFRNMQGKGFRDVTRQAGLDMVFATMGSNYGDFDNDGYLDMYLGTGEPNLATLIPNRMFKNMAGERFVEITGSAGVGHLQKGHGVACGDWDRDGNIDIFIEVGGAIPGDRFHNVLFQNPGHDNRWLSVKLVGKQTNRAALGARIKIETTGEHPQTVHRHVTQGSSFGSSPLEQTIGLGQADRVALLEIHWPASGTTQVFRDLRVDQAIEVTEFSSEYRVLERKPIALPGQ